MLSSSRILDLVRKHPQRGIAGQVAVLRRNQSNGTGGRMGMATSLTSAQDKLLKDLSADGPPPRGPQPYQHPGAGAVDRTYPGDRTARTTPLTATELAWLNRLPTDPAQVSFADAKALAELKSSMGGGPELASDRRLLDSIWAPIQEHHDLAAADVDIANATNRPQLPPVPSSALPALADAVGNENDQLSSDEVITRANLLLRDAVSRRQADADGVLQVAHSRRDAALARRAARTATTADGRGAA